MLTKEEQSNFASSEDPKDKVRIAISIAFYVSSVSTLSYDTQNLALLAAHRWQVAYDFGTIERVYPWIFGLPNDPFGEFERLFGMQGWNPDDIIVDKFANVIPTKDYLDELMAGIDAYKFDRTVSPEEDF